MMAAAAAAFLYYSFWTFVLVSIFIIIIVTFYTNCFLQPFVDESSFLQYLFLPREWATRLPVALLLVALAGVGSFVGKVLAKNAEKEKRKQAAAKAK